MSCARSRKPAPGSASTAWRRTTAWNGRRGHRTLAVLEVRDLHVFYGNIEALKGISLQADAGQIVAILGGNGAGKTTTLRTISGLLRPRSGSITCNGKSLVGLSAHGIVAMGISHVPEGRRIFNVLTVEENLTLGGYLIRSKHQLIKERNAAVF